MSNDLPGPCVPSNTEQCKLANLNELLKTFHAELERLREKPKTKDIWERSQVTATIVATVLLPLVLLFVGQSYTTSTARTSLRVAHGNLIREAIGELTSGDVVRQSLAVNAIRTALENKEDPKQMMRSDKLIEGLRRSLQLEFLNDIEAAQATVDHLSAIAAKLKDETYGSLENNLDVQTSLEGLALIDDVLHTYPEMVTPGYEAKLNRAKTYLEGVVMRYSNEAAEIKETPRDKIFKTMVRKGVTRAMDDWEEVVKSTKEYLAQARMVTVDAQSDDKLQAAHNAVRAKLIPRVRDPRSPPEILRLIDMINTKHTRLKMTFAW